MSRQWNLREYKEGDEPNILAMHKLVFNSQVSSELWTWQYKRNPAGQAIIVLAESDKGIVGQYAVVPRLIKIDDNICIGSLSLDTMVHPEYRNQGMFISLTERVYALAAEREIHFIYGFPNKNSHHGFITRLDWVDIYNGIPLWIKPLNLQRVLRKRFVDNKLLASLGDKVSNIALRMVYRPQRLPPVCSIKEVSSFDRRFDSLWNKTSNDHRITLIRDSTYLNWRFGEKPGNCYTVLIAETGANLSGYVILRSLNQFGLQIGFIVDIITDLKENKVSRDLISAAVKHFELKQMDMVGCLMLPNVHYSQNLRQAGFIMAPNRLLPQKMYLGVRNLTRHYPSTFLVDRSNWFVTWGDHDDI